MAHGGYGKRRVEEPRPLARRAKALGVERGKKKQKKTGQTSLKNQIRSIDRLLRKNLPAEMREAQEQKLEDLKRQQEIHTRLAVERKMHLRNKKIKFIERRKIERSIRRLEKQQRSSSDHALAETISHQLSKLKEDLEYVQFFPKTEKYVSLLVGGDNPKIVEKRNKLRKQIKANLMAAAASGKDLEETASDDDALDMSNDDFFANSSSDEAEADDELTDKSTREPSSSAYGKTTSGMSSDEKNQRQISARALMPPPRSLPASRFRSIEKTNPPASSNPSRNRIYSSSRSSGPASRSLPLQKSTMPSSSNASHTRIGSSSRSWGSAKSDNNSNLSSNSDAHKPRRKRRPKKKKQASVTGI